MKSEKGITLTSLVIYVIVATILISSIALLSSFFFSNMYLIKDHNQYAPEFNKFNMFFIKDIKNNKNAEVTENKIIFDDGNLYEYKSEEQAIYRNNKKIAEKVQNISFSSNSIEVVNTTKQIITVNITIGSKGDFKQKIEYVLKYW